VQVEYGDYITLLTGRADYAMFNVIERGVDQGTPSGLQSWLRFKLILTRLSSAELKNILQTNDLRVVGAMLQRITLAVHHNMSVKSQAVLLEAKKVDLENLHDLEPQAIAECITV